ncbi:patatin-like phospholipase family protein [Gordonia sp. NPDC003376]
MNSCALVLGGGGSGGNAWEIGVLAGLEDAGVDVTDADLIIGTSAGSTTAAQITGARPAQLFADIRDTPQPTVSRGGSGAGRTHVADQMARTAAIIADAHDPADMRRRMGAAALALTSDAPPAGRPSWRDIVASRLPSLEWPDRDVRIVAVDAETGEPVVFDRRSGVDLADAVAASCASGEPHRIAQRHFIDGGYRSNENADLATGFEHVLVLSPFGGRFRTPAEWGMNLAAQVDTLRSAGGEVETIFPDADSVTAFGANMMDLRIRPRAAQAGYHQGAALAVQTKDFWH